MPRNCVFFWQFSLLGLIRSDTPTVRKQDPKLRRLHRPMQFERPIGTWKRLFNNSSEPLGFWRRQKIDPFLGFRLAICFHLTIGHRLFESGNLIVANRHFRND